MRLAALCLLLCACRTTPKPPPDATAPSASAPAPTPAPAPVLSLLSPGSPPLRSLRLTPRPSSTQHLIVTTRTTSSLAPSIPTITLAMDLTILAVTAAGTIDYSFVLTDARAAGDSPLTAATNAALTSAIGVNGLARVSAQGATLATQLSLPESAPPQLRQLLGGLQDSFDSMSFPLPSEPVGVGARWQLVATTAQNGIPVTSTSTYELTAITGDVLTVKTTLTQAAATQPTTALPNARLVSLTTTGTGEADVDLTKVVAPRATSSTTTDSTMTLDAEQVSVQMTVAVDVR